MESVNKVRLKYHRKGETIKGIVRSTGLSRNTIRKYLRNNKTHPKYQRTVIHAPKLGDFKEILHGWLLDESKLPKKERSDATQLFEKLQGCGYLGAYDQVQRYAKAFKQGTHLSNQVFIPLAFEPGEAYQFDWSEEHVELKGLIHKVHVAHFRLCYSRKSFIAVYWRESQEMLFDAHIRAFEYFGGVPLRGPELKIVR